MKIGILQCGRAPESLVERYGDYDDMFVELVGPTFEYATFAVLDNEFPSDVFSADGWIITGSKYGVYEDHEWIPPLEQFLRDAFEAEIPIAGFCFGHQILAQALGGKVEKFDGGWSVGQVSYDLEDSYYQSLGTSVDSQPAQLRINAFHQDQVIAPPACATTTGSTDFCKHAFLAYGDQAITMQPHPEFDDAFSKELIDTRGREVLPPEVVDVAMGNFTETLSQAVIAKQLQEFFSRRSDYSNTISNNTALTSSRPKQDHEQRPKS